MTPSFILVCLWVIAAWALSLLPTKKAHWPLAYGLIAVGLPLLAYIVWDSGPIAGLLAFAVGCIVLRWPVRYGWRWIVRTFGGKAAE